MQTYSEIPLQKKFSMLLDSAETRDDMDSQSAERKSIKNKASSPLERDMTFKKQKEGNSEIIDSDSESVTTPESPMETERHETNHEIEKLSYKQNGGINDRDINTAASKDTSQNFADSVTSSNSDSNQGVQKSPDISEYVNNQPLNQTHTEQETLETNMASNSKPVLLATPNSKSVQMPGYFEASNDLYYGPQPLLSQPTASLPFSSTNFSSNTQNMSLQSSESMRCNTGNNELS